MAYNTSYNNQEWSTRSQNTSYAPPLGPPIIHTHKDLAPSFPPGYHSTQDLHELEALRGQTPSPSPSEARALRGSRIEGLKYMLRNKPWYFLIFAVIITLVVLISVYDDKIINWLKPATKWLHDRPGGWLVPIAVLFVISFPPLFGHEIVVILCGVVWGLGIGFAIAAAGTLLGEIANYYVFRYWCRARGEKYEKKNVSYGCLARVIREGGFIIALIVRLSAIPSHFTTTIFATCGMNIFVFVAAAVLTLPKQLIAVYIGVILEENAEGTESSKSRTINNIILIVTTLITIVAMVYVKYKARKLLPDVVYQRRKARQAKVEAQINAQRSPGLGHSRDHSDTSTYGDQYHAESDILLPVHTKNMGSISGVSDTTIVNSHEGSSSKPHGPYLGLPQFEFRSKSR